MTSSSSPHQENRKEVISGLKLRQVGSGVGRMAQMMWMTTHSRNPMNQITTRLKIFLKGPSGWHCKIF